MSKQRINFNDLAAPKVNNSALPSAPRSTYEDEGDQQQSGYGDRDRYGGGGYGQRRSQPFSSGGSYGSNDMSGPKKPSKPEEDDFPALGEAPKPKKTQQPRREPSTSSPSQSYGSPQPQGDRYEAPRNRSNPFGDAKPRESALQTNTPTSPASSNDDAPPAPASDNTSRPYQPPRQSSEERSSYDRDNRTSPFGGDRQDRGFGGDRQDRQYGDRQQQEPKYDSRFSNGVSPFGNMRREGGGDRQDRGGYGGDRDNRSGGYGGDRQDRGGYGGDRENRSGGYGGDRQDRGGYGGDRENRGPFGNMRREGGGDRGGYGDRDNRGGYGGERQNRQYEDREPRAPRESKVDSLDSWTSGAPVSTGAFNRTKTDRPPREGGYGGDRQERPRGDRESPSQEQSQPPRDE
eukprot:gene5661-6536_t